MMRTNYKVMYAYTLNECFKAGLAYLLYGDYPKASTKIITRSIFSVTCGVNAPDNTQIPEDYLDKKNTDLLNLIFERYWDEYIFESEEQWTYPANLSDYPDVQYKIRRFAAKLINLIQFTYPKYSVLLKAYDDERANLTAKLERITDGTATQRNNDTPQDGGDFDDDNHTSFISQGKVDNTESWDSEPIIDRLDKISRLYHKVMEEWLDEFKDLFVEGGNYL